MTESATGTSSACKEDIAIIGMACRLPGAHNIDEFWTKLVNRSSVFSPVPEGRWEPLSGDIRGSEVGGFLNDIYGFDHGFFNMSEKEAVYSDPQHRLLLEMAWETSEHAGINLLDLAGENVGVFTGSCNHDFSISLWPKCDGVYTSTGTSAAVAANRISYTYKLTGPSISLDSACSSSLSAVHFAIQSLRAGDCDMALVGGSNLLLLPSVMSSLANAGLVSKSGNCKPFEDDADGFIRSEGAAMVMLQPLEKALENDSNVIAVIKGSAINHNGASNGLSAPNPAAQLNLLEKACRCAGVTPDEVGYLESAATGTRIGDAIEAKVIAEFYGKGRSADTMELKVGSLKGSFGHLEGLGGIVSLIKAAMALSMKYLPAGISKENRNRLIPINHNISYVDEPGEWRGGNNAKRIAGVNSFGFGGANAHVILEEAPSVQIIDKPDLDTYVLPISAKSEPSLFEYVKTYKNYLEKNADTCEGALFFNSTVRRAHFGYREAFHFSSLPDLRKQLAEFLLKKNKIRICSSTRPLALYLNGGRASGLKIFGEGSPLFQRILEEAARLLASSAIKDYSRIAKKILDKKAPCDEVITNFVYEVCLARWVKEIAYPVKAHFVEGAGELSALVVLGHLGLIEALELLTGRNQEPLEINVKLPIVHLNKSPRYISGMGVNKSYQAANRSRGFDGREDFSDTVVVGASINIPSICALMEASTEDYDIHAFDTEFYGNSMSMLAGLYKSGVDILWRNNFAGTREAHLALPHYPYERRNCWPVELVDSGEGPEKNNISVHLAVDHVERYLESTLSRILGRAVSNQECEVGMTLMGFDSMKAADLKHTLYNQIGFEISFPEILGGDLTLAELIVRIRDFCTRGERNKEMTEPPFRATRKSEDFIEVKI